jgi:hypothetical protein
LIAARLGEQRKGVRSTAAEGAFLLWLLSFGQAKESDLLPGNPGPLSFHLRQSLEYHP